MDSNEDHDLSFCDGCVYGKHHRTPFPRNPFYKCEEMCENYWACTHKSMWSHGNNISWRAKYFLTYIDDFFKIFFYTIKIKLGVFTKLKVLKVLVEIRASLYVSTVWKIVGEGDQPKTIKKKSKKEKGETSVEPKLAPFNEKKF
jgi:hypothetical protein